jgi:hypothetical protein
VNNDSIGSGNRNHNGIAMAMAMAGLAGLRRKTTVNGSLAPSKVQRA